MTLPRLTLRLRIVLCFARAVVGLVAATCWLLVQSEQVALRKLAAENSRLARSAADQQSAALEGVLDDQIQSSEAELQTKAESLARVLADLAPTALLTFDTNALVALCKQATRDPDIDECTFFDAQDKKVGGDYKSRTARRGIRNERRPRALLCRGNGRIPDKADSGSGTRRGFG
jgi:hypothetical protein